jgi:hypothetical protein
MRKNTTPTELLLAKLERPIHISYISEYLLKLPIDVCQTKINELIKSDLVEESQYGKGYYVRKKMK